MLISRVSLATSPNNQTRKGMEFLTVGNFIVDEVYDLDEYPKEDSKVRAKSYSLHAGGNAANVAFMLKKLLQSNDDNVSICASIGDDILGSFLLEECSRRSISSKFISQLAKQETSKTVVLRNTPSRTCIHLKSCPDVDFCSFAKRFNSKTSHQYYWVHFEGRNTKETMKMMQLVSQTSPNNLLSLELERSRLGDEFELLKASPSICVFSSHYLESYGFAFDTVLGFFEQFLLAKGLAPTMAAMWVVTFGSRGSVSCIVSPEGLVDNTYYHYCAPSQVQVVDSLGAGDCFMAGLIHFVALHGLEQRKAIEFATKVAVEKLQRVGI